jgi:ATP-dependent protease ClpP protease subunit
MANKIFITGQIGGEIYNAQGEVTGKGVTVVEVASKLAIVPTGEAVTVVINSPGGSVEVGEQIGELLANTPNVSTLASVQCASIATVIHTSVPIENRFIEEGCEYMIHAPLFTNISGNADELQYAAEVLAPIENKLADHYAKTTGQSKSIIKPLMKAESYLTPEDCVNLGFASAVVPKEVKEFHAIAFLDSQNSKTNNMSNINAFKKKVRELAVAMKIVEADPVDNGNGADGSGADAREAVALTMETDKGILVTPFSDIMQGDPVTLEDGETVPEDGVYTIADGSTITVVGGFISDYTIAEGSAIEDAEMIAIIEAKDSEIAALKLVITEHEEAQALATQVIEKLEAKAQRSSFKPNVSASANFRTQGGQGAPKTETRISKEAMAARRAELNAKKA